MAGSRQGAQKVKAKLLARDPDYYKKIGAKGGRNGTGVKGFAANKELAREAGKKGGAISRRSKSIN